MLTNPELINYERIQRIITNIPSLPEKALSCLAYCTGSRVSELNQIKKSDFITEKEYLVITCLVLKKRTPKKTYRRALVRLDESWLIDPIKAYMLSCETEILFPLHRATIYRKLIDFTGINPHGFRKLRATHLVIKYGFNGQQIKQFFDWSRSDMADNYVKLNISDIMY